MTSQTETKLGPGLGSSQQVSSSLARLFGAEGVLVTADLLKVAGAPSMCGLPNGRRGRSVFEYEGKARKDFFEQRSIRKKNKKTSFKITKNILSK